MLLEVNKIDAGYGSLMVLRDVSLHVARGEIVCVIGPNGAGKSTVLRAMAGQITPAGRSVLLKGKDVNGVDMAAKRSRFSTGVMSWNWAVTGRPEPAGSF